MRFPVTVRNSDGQEARSVEIDNTPGCATNPRVRVGDRQQSVSVGVGGGSFLNIDFATGIVELANESRVARS